MITGNETKTEIEIYKFCKDNPKLIHESTILEVAELCFTTAPSISKYIKKCDFSGYEEFKNYFYNNFYFDKVRKSDIVESYKEKINAAINTLDITQIRNVCNGIDESEEIIVYGVGSSGEISRYLKNNMLRLGYKVMYEQSYYSCIEQLKARPNALLILFSHSGNTDLIKSIIKRIGSHVFVVGISSNDHSRLMDRSNLKINYVDHMIENSSFANNSMLIQTIICDLILDELSNYKDLSSKYNTSAD